MSGSPSGSCSGSTSGRSRRTRLCRRPSLRPRGRAIRRPSSDAPRHRRTCTPRRCSPRPSFGYCPAPRRCPRPPTPKPRTWMPTKFFLLATTATRPRRAAAAAGALCWPAACGVACAPACGFVCEVACGVACGFASCAISAAVALASRRNVLRSRRDFMGSSSLWGRMGDAPAAPRVSRATFVSERIAAPR